MPIFFWISGFLGKKIVSAGELKEYIIKKTERLLLPYFMWSGISFAANLLLGKIQGILSVEYAKSEFFEIFLYSRAVWFLVILYLTSVIAGLMEFVSAKAKCNRYLLLAGMWVVIAIEPYSKILCIYKMKWLFPFYIFGIAAKQYKIYDKTSTKVLTMAGVLFPILAIVFYREEYFQQYVVCSYNGLNSLIWGVGYYIISALSILLVMAISRGVENIKIGKAIAQFGQYSMEIYVIHMFFVKFLPLLPNGIIESSFLAGLYLGFYALIIVVFVFTLSKYVLNHFRIFRMSVGKL